MLGGGGGDPTTLPPCTMEVQQQKHLNETQIEYDFILHVQCEFESDVKLNKWKYKHVWTVDTNDFSLIFVQFCSILI